MNGSGIDLLIPQRGPQAFEKVVSKKHEVETSFRRENNFWPGTERINWQNCLI